MKKEKVGLKDMMGVVGVVIVAIPFLIINGFSVLVVMLHSLLIYSFGSEQDKIRRRKEMSIFRENIFRMD